MRSSPQKTISPEKVDHGKVRALAMICGLLVALMGSSSLAGWWLGLETLRSIYTGWWSMKANTALGLLLSGIALAIGSRERRPVPLRAGMVALAVLVVGLSGATLAEYFFKVNFGIDQLLVRDPTDRSGISVPGRMVPTTALCLALSGLALLTASWRGPARFRISCLTGLAASIAIIGLLVMILPEIPMSTGLWGRTGVAQAAGVSFVLLGCGILALARIEGLSPWTLDRWTTVAFLLGVFMMLIVVNNSYQSTIRLQQTTMQLGHRQEVLKEIEEMLAAESSLQSTERGYILTGDESILEGRKQVRAGLTEDIRDFLDLTADNPEQQRNGIKLRSLVSALTSWQDRAISARRLQGISAGTQISLQEARLWSSIHGTLKQMREHEYGLLAADERRAEGTAQVTFMMLPFGVFFSLSVLILALVFLNAGIHERLQTKMELRDSEMRKAAVMAAALDCIIVVDEEGRISDFNPATLNTFGHTHAELLGRDLAETILPPASREFLRQEMGPDRESKPGRRFEITAVRADGTEFPAELAVETVRLRERPMFTAYLRDISKRKQAETELKNAEQSLLELNADLERRVADRTGELQAINQELESFCYNVSHDLRAPLRAIAGFTRILEENYGSAFDEAGRRHFDRVTAAADRMGELIDDLLNLSRVTRSSFVREPVDLTRLAESIAADLRAGAPERQVEFVIAEGLETEGDLRLLRITLESLLDNAWKFTSQEPAARIEFSSRRTGEGTVFAVSDNGVGFDMLYIDKLFTPFQRLHGQSEFPGTGIGLATVQRIISRHGGRIWADGAVGKGATFQFII